VRDPAEVVRAEAVLSLGLFDDFDRDLLVATARDDASEQVRHYATLLLGEPAEGPADEG
jgi:hypothetical protein